MPTKLFDTAIIGGGLSGLALSILLSKAGKEVVLFEKENYPFHKVCGEYISNESVPFLKSLGTDLESQNLPQMNKLFLTSPSGISIIRNLDIGGTGLSRYHLDDQLYHLALSAGVKVLTNTKVHQVTFMDNNFIVNTSDSIYNSRTVAGAYGKNSSIDVQLNRNYKAKNDSKLFVAVKHHIRAEYDYKRVEIHNFPGGYCGFSAIDDGMVNMSYISKAVNLKKSGSIDKMEKNILSTNPYLKKYFENADFISPKPLTISHLYFGIKQSVTDHILMLGDAAGNIAPFSGNGMSMALKSSKLASEVILSYLKNEITLDEMDRLYTKNYNQSFAKRINVARQINSLLGNAILTDVGFCFLKVFPGMIDILSKRVHGDIF